MSDEKPTTRNPAQDMRDAGILPAPRNAKEAAADRIVREGVSDDTVDAYLAEFEPMSDETPDTAALLAETPEVVLRRYGVVWEGHPTAPILVLMADGYWTPWHLAAAALRAALAREQQMQAESFEHWKQAGQNRLRAEAAERDRDALQARLQDIQG